MVSSGIDYFPMNVDFWNDDKIELIECEFGIKGALIVIKLLCKIYREGYYYQWGEDECLLFANKVGKDIDAELVDKVVHRLVSRGFFDEELFNTHQVLTSRGIQKRYFEAVKRRKELNIRKEFLLMDVSDTTKSIKKVNYVDISDENVDISKENADIFQQTKLNETKLNETKGEGESKRESTPTTHTESFLKFMEWISVNAPWCAEHLTMPTEQELEILKQNWHRDDVVKTIRNLENNRTLREKYTNLFTTITNWLERDEKERRIMRLSPASSCAAKTDSPVRKLTPEEEKEKSINEFKARLKRDAENGNEEARRRLAEMEQSQKISPHI